MSCLSVLTCTCWAAGATPGCRQTLCDTPQPQRRYTRNPQYGGDFAVLLGIAIFSNSLLAMTISIVGIFCFWMAPLAEEPWLRQQYGRVYEEYCRTVPRFIGFRTKHRN